VTFAEVGRAREEPSESGVMSAMGLGRRVYALGLRALYGRSGLPWSVNGKTVRIDPRVRHLVPHEGEPDVDRYLQATLQPGDAVLDVGAFVGIHAIMSARKVGPEGRVIAFEPTPATAALARRHFAYNGLGDGRIHLVEAAVSDRPGRATFHQYALPYVNSLAPAVDTTGRPTATDVEVVTIDEVCRAQGVVPRLIRMDVQGAEVHALRGAQETIRRAGDRLVLLVEMHPQCWPAFDVTESIVRDTIRELGLVASPLVPGDRLFARDSHAILTPEARAH
jgi:FkbM family methyltransferase